MEKKWKNSEKPIYPLQHEGFPSVDRYVEQDEGMLAGLTKREHFAGLALQGLLSTLSADSYLEFAPNIKNVEYVAQLSVLAADKLLEELENQTTNR
jgi:hypothetical protein